MIIVIIINKIHGFMKTITEHDRPDGLQRSEHERSYRDDAIPATRCRRNISQQMLMQYRPPDVDAISATRCRRNTGHQMSTQYRPPDVDSISANRCRRNIGHQMSTQYRPPDVNTGHQMSMATRCKFGHQFNIGHQMSIQATRCWQMLKLNVEWNLFPLVNFSMSLVVVRL